MSGRLMLRSTSRFTRRTTGGPRGNSRSTSVSAGICSPVRRSATTASARMTSPSKIVFGTLGAIAFPGTNGYSRNLWDTEYHDFGPRVGAAYQLGHNMVLRSGFGITYLPSNTGYFSSPNEYGEESFSPGTQMLPYGLNPAGVPVTQFTDPAPIVAATGSNAAAPQIYGGSNALFTRHMQNGIAKQGNIFVERSFGGRGEWLASVGYSFSYSNHLQNRN